MFISGDTERMKRENATMTIVCSCGQQWTLGQWPSGSYSVICSCGNPLLSHDGTGAAIMPQKKAQDSTPKPEFTPPTAETPYVVGADPASEHGRAA